MRRVWLLVPLLLLGVSTETVPPLCTVAQLAAGTCAPSELGTRVRISNGDAADDLDCAVGTGAILVLCEFDGVHWTTSTIGGSFRFDGTDWYVDENGNDVLDLTEPNLTGTACTGSPCNVSIPGDLVVTGAMTETGVTQMHETLLAAASDFGTTVANTGECLPFWTNVNDGTWLAAACTGNNKHYEIPFRSQITRFCYGAQGTTATGGQCIVELFDATAAVVIGQIDLNTAGGDTNGTTSFCDPVGVTVNAQAQLHIRGNSVTCNTVGGVGPGTYTVWGYGIDP